MDSIPLTQVLGVIEVSSGIVELSDAFVDTRRQGGCDIKAARGEATRVTAGTIERRASITDTGVHGHLSHGVKVKCVRVLLEVCIRKHHNKLRAASVELDHANMLPK